MDGRARLRAVRTNHWAGNARPLPGPDGLLWLLTDREWLLGLDPVLGDRRVDQPAAAGVYTVFTGGWPHVVRRRDAGPLPTVSIARGRLVTTVDGRETGSVALPEALGKDAHARLDGAAAWVFHHPSRGETPMRIACFDIEAQTFGAVHDLDFSTVELAVAGSRLALFDEARGRVDLYDRERLLRSITHVPSASWGKVALSGSSRATPWHASRQGDELAVVSHQRDGRPGAFVGIGWCDVADGAMRRFALHTQGATDVTFLDGWLAIHQYGDVTLVARAALRAAPPGELVLEIENLATRPPPPAQTAKVTFVGATTGFGFVQSETLGRLRFSTDPDRPAAVGEMVAIDDFEAGVVRRWHHLEAGPRPLDPANRCLEPAAWSDFESLLGRKKDEAEEKPAPAPDAAYCTSVRVGAYLSDPDRDDEAVDDVDALRALDGTLERSGDLLDHLSDDESGAGSELVALRPTLRFGGEPSRLHLALEFYTRRAPSDDDLAGFARTAERLLESGWGTNYEFDAPSGYGGCHVALDFELLGTSTRRLADA